jgi:hypothetical protein
MPWWSVWQWNVTPKPEAEIRSAKARPNYLIFKGNYDSY